MIAFSKRVLEAESRASKTRLVVVPEVIVTESTAPIQTNQPSTYEVDSNATDVATKQEELAMLQRALFRCGLVDIQTNDEESNGNGYPVL